MDRSLLANAHEFDRMAIALELHAGLINQDGYGNAALELRDAARSLRTAAESLRSAAPAAAPPPAGERVERRNER